MAIHIRRREFIFTLGGAAAAWPVAVRAQQPAIPVIGFIHAGSPGPSARQVERFREGLAESGFIVDQNVAVKYHWAEGRYDRLPAFAADLVERRVAVLAVGGGPAAVLAAKAATTTIPVVFVSGDDPVKYGLVASLHRPGGNMTGAVFFNVALVGKRLELLRELIPAAASVGFVLDPNNPEAEHETRDLAAATRALALRLDVLNPNDEGEFDATFAKVAQQRTDALLIASSPALFGRRNQLVALATRYSLPAIYPVREWVLAGGLASYGNSIPDAYRQSGVYAGYILKGTKPADLPIAQSTRFELAINLKTAKTLRLTVPPTVLARADEVIE
jgi:putative ABC transport system substrate-binding protein